MSSEEKNEKYLKIRKYYLEINYTQLFVWNTFLDNLKHFKKAVYDKYVEHTNF